MNPKPPNVRKTLAIGLALLPVLAGCATPSQMAADAEVRRLCAIDGGVRVYETVKLPAEKFNQWGQPNFYRPDRGENALGSEYVFKAETRHLQKERQEGGTEVWRSHDQVIRRLDRKLLSESVVYVRRGGDLPGPWHPSSFRCPGPKEMGLIEKTFILERSSK